MMKLLLFIGAALCILSCPLNAKAQAANAADVQKIQAFIEKIKKEEIEAANNYADLKDRRVRIQEDLDEAANANSDLAGDKKNLSGQLKTLKKQEKIALDNLKSWDKKLAEAGGWIGLSPVKLHKKALELDREDSPAVAAAPPATESDVETESAVTSKNLPDTLSKSASAPVVEKSAAASEEMPVVGTGRDLSLHGRDLSLHGRNLKARPKKIKNKPADPEKEATALTSETVPAGSASAASVETARRDRSRPVPAPPAAESKTKENKKAEAQEPDDRSAAPREITFKKYNAAEDVALNPPFPECKVDFEGRDQLTGKKRKDFAPRVLFTHTEDFMKPQFKDKDYITCEAQGIWIEGGARFLNLYFTIQSKDAPRSFGFLEKGSAVSFILVNGKVAKFNTAKTDVGTVDANANQTSYRAVLAGSPAEYKLLTESEVGDVRVVWSTGFETYEVYNTDLMMSIVKCMDK